VHRGGGARSSEAAALGHRGHRRSGRGRGDGPRAEEGHRGGGGGNLGSLLGSKTRRAPRT
jgi:hypothetical protein